MVIGFTQRMRTVFEGVVYDIKIPIDIDVATLRPSEREHPMVFRVQSGGTAIVEPKDDPTDPLLDALFGSRSRHGSVQEEFVLGYLQYTIPSLKTQIRDDLRPEDEECFTISIIPRDVPGRKKLFDCYEEYHNSDATSYFCETTICIEDNEGRSILYHCIV